jgi:hypothetical protein
MKVWNLSKGGGGGKHQIQTSLVFIPLQHTNKQISLVLESGFLLGWVSFHYVVTPNIKFCFIFLVSKCFKNQ